MIQMMERGIQFSDAFDDECMFLSDFVRQKLDKSKFRQLVETKSSLIPGVSPWEWIIIPDEDCKNFEKRTKLRFSARCALVNCTSLYQEIAGIEVPPEMAVIQAEEDGKYYAIFFNP